MHRLYSYLGAATVVLSLAACKDQDRSQNQQRSGGAQVQQAQQESEQAYGKAKQAQEQATKQEGEATKSEQEALKKRQEASEAEQKAQQDRQQSQQAQEQARSAGGQAQRRAQSAQERATAAQQQAAQQHQADQQQAQQSMAQQPSGAPIVARGKIQSATADEIVIQRDNAPELHVKIDPQQTTIVTDGKPGSMSDIGTGTNVSVSYRMNRDQAVADRVETTQP
ncbi:MAG: putative lipoprotein [Myxococcales bacterium]|nr:putative lipoprotein [Myxococcales bacterium]